MKNILLEKIQENRAVVGIVGLGYVGLPLALRFLEEDFNVVGFDVDPAKIEKLESGTSYIEHIDPEPFSTALQAGKFIATIDFSRISAVDAIILCVPTPLNKNREPDLSFVLGSLNSIIPYMRAGQIVALESTTYPGTTEEKLLPPILAAGFSIVEDSILR